MCVTLRHAWELRRVEQTFGVTATAHQKSNHLNMLNILKLKTQQFVLIHKLSESSDIQT